MQRLFLAAAIVLSLAAVSDAYYPYRVHHGGSTYSPPTAYFNGGFIGPGFYLPYSGSVTPTYGGALWQMNGGSLGYGFYNPYSAGWYTPGYYGGYGYGMGMY